VFSNDLAVGVLVLAAIACAPGLALATLAAVAVAAAGTWLLGMGSAVVRAGGVGCIAVLSTLAIFMFSPDGGSPAVVVLASALLAVLFSASFQAVFANVALPTHALPFVAATWTLHLALRSMPASGSLADLAQPLTWIPGELWRPSWLDGPAAIVFSHGVLPGLLLMLAILVHSRISFLLALVGAAVSAGLRWCLRTGQPWTIMDATAFFNAMLSAMAIGGVWFVPQPSSVLLAAASAALSVFLTFALFPLLGLASLPVISLPFVLAVMVILTAARMRQQDRWPRSTIPAERPEEALARHLVRVRRFGNLAWLPFRLPFRGEWFVSQGHDGEYTHKGLWRHGLDFEGRTPEGKAHKDSGKELRDYVCYGLPVVAAGAGTVALVEDGIPDNRPGELNTRDNWGNAVVIRHGEGLYSVCAHLQPKSLRVKVGDVVTPGMEIGRCGNSGRSAIPHLHFQVQRAKVLGSPTIAFDFGDVVERKGDAFLLWNHTVPGENDVVRPAQRDDQLARVMSWAPGTAFELHEPATGQCEQVRVEIDLHGTRSLRSEQGRLIFDAYDNALVLADYSGGSDTLLRYLLLAWARLPFDLSANLTWTDALSRRLLVPRWLRFLADLWVVVVPEFGKLDVEYSMRREEGRVLVEGKAETWNARSRLSLAGEPHTIDIEHKGKRTQITMKPVELPDEQDGS
jgi:murein DD-endopeptidase MepM/ murein hydrolase activator NlpD/urea transporter